MPHHAYGPGFPPPIYVAASSSTTVGGGGADVLLGGMTVSPGIAGTYRVTFMGQVGNPGSGTSTFVSLYAGGVQIPHTEREFQQNTTILGLLSVIEAPSSTQAIVTIAALDAIETRWRTSAGTATALGRSMIVERVA